MKKAIAIINGGIGSKVICAVTDDVTLEAAPIKGTDNGDGTASLLVTSSMAVLPDTTSGDLADINAASASINDKLPALVGGKIPVDASVSIDPAGLATQATLADILAKIIAAPSTEAKQDLILTALGLIATEATTGDIKTATEALAALISSGALKVSMATLPDTSTGSLFNMATDINTMQPDIAAAKSDIGTMKTDIATAKADISAMKADIAAIRAILES